LDTELNLELAYFDKVEAAVDSQLEQAVKAAKERQSELSEHRSDAEDDLATAIDKEEKMMSVALYLSQMARETLAVESSRSKEATLRAAKSSPYFARIDFTNGSRDRKCYIGRSTIRGESIRDMFVYDWRAPVASMFYRYGVGPASYTAPAGEIEGTLTLKRQFEIKNAKFEYYFDSDVQIVDEYLRQLLSKNASDKMKTIIETIQRDQDEIIRDMQSDLLMVQGAAGSGKTSIALHRAAYLMYEGMSAKLSAHNIAILSPNRLFERYIANVLPELGERSAASFVFADLIRAVLGNDVEFETKFEELEAIVTGEVSGSDAEYKASAEFAERIRAFAESISPQFQDVYYNGKLIYTAAELSEMFSKTGSALAVRLEKLEEEIFEKIHRLRPARIRELEQEAQQLPEHSLEVKEYARMVSIEESTALIKQVRQFTKLDYINLYFEMLGESPRYPLSYRDAVGITLLKLTLEPYRPFGDIRQVVVDEAQDYDSVHFEILRRLFPSARYTILGDVNQTIGKSADVSLYHRIQNALKANSPNLVTLSRSFRSTKEILDFSAKLIGKEIDNFGRSGETPQVLTLSADNILAELAKCKEMGYESVALICNSESSSKEIFEQLNGVAEVRRLSGSSDSIKGVFVLPAYMAKGLEFDAVLVCRSEEYEPNALYVACTRALHYLRLFETEAK